MRKITKIVLFKLASSCLLVLLSASGAFPVTSEVSPSHISINSLYHGSRITVSGEADAGSEIIIKISSPEKKMHLRKKGKKGGLLWMNVGELEFDSVSDIYLVYSTKDINSILSSDEQDKYSLGYEAFRRLVEVSPVNDEAEKKKWVDEFLKFKEKRRTYGVIADGIETGTTGDKETYTLSIDWPYQASPQEYTVSAYAVKDNMVQSHGETPLTVETVGALRFISNMAFNNASLYGIISIFIAIAAGFIVSVIFKGGGGSH